MTYFHSNEPIDNVRDDFYNYSQYAYSIQDAIRKSAITDEPLVFGVYGRWGDGKSSFLNFLFKNLELSDETKYKKILKFKFNPWRYSTEDKVLLEFFNGLIKVINHEYNLKDKDSLIEKLVNYAKMVLKGTSIEIEKGWNLGYKYTTKAAFDFDKVLGSNQAKSIEDQKEEIDNALKNYKFRIVIFLDDIDRLNKAEIYNLFRLIKLTASFRSITYILSFDLDMVAKAIYLNYGDEVEDGYRYIEKIVNIPLKLPKLDSFKILGSLNSGLASIFVKNEIDTNKVTAKPNEHTFETGMNRFYVEIEGIEKLLETPREIVRLLNSFSVSLLVLKNEVNYADLLWLEFLRLKFPNLYHFVKQNPSLFIVQVFPTTISDTVKAPYYDQVGTFLKENKVSRIKERNCVYEILDKLFPYHQSLNDLLSSKRKDILDVKSNRKLSKIERRINHNEIFSLYFQYNTDGVISLVAIEPLFKSLSNAEDYKESDHLLKDLIAVYNKAKLRYELLDKTKSFKQNQKDEKKRLIELLLRNVEELHDNELFLDKRKATTKQELIQDIFENLSSFDEKTTIEITKKFIENIEVQDLLYVRRGLYHDKFEGTQIQNILDTKIIDYLKVNYIKDEFFTKYPEFISRSLLTIWHKFSKDDLKLYLNKTINSTNLVEFLKCFPTWWEGTNGDYLDDFGDKEYKSLRRFIDPKFIYEIINRKYSIIVNEVESNKSAPWDKKQNKEDLDIVRQFVYWYFKIQLKKEMF